MIGTLIHLLVCRVKFGTETTSSFTDLMHHLQSQLGSAMLNQYSSLAEIQNSLKLGGQPLFNSLVSILYSAPDQLGTGEDAIQFKHVKTSASSEVSPILTSRLR